MRAISSITLDSYNSKKDDFYFDELDTNRIQLKELEEQFEVAGKSLLNVEKLFDDVMLGKSKMSIEFVSNKMEEFGAKKISLLEKIDKLKKEIEEAEATGSNLDKLKYRLTNWTDTYKYCNDFQQKKAMLSQVITEVVISKESFVIKYHIAIEKVLKGSIL